MQLSSDGFKQCSWNASTLFQEEVKDKKDKDKDKDKDKKDKDKKEEKEDKKDEAVDLSSQQAVAVLGLALIAMGEDIGAEMILRSFGHLVRVLDRFFIVTACF